MVPHSLNHSQRKNQSAIRPSLNDILLFFVFFLSLLPYSPEWGADAVTATYCFLVLFIVHIRTVALTVSASRVILAFALIFCAGFSTLLFEDPNYQIRTWLSFLAFIAPFCLLFIRFKEHDLSLFIYAVILASLLYSIKEIASFVTSGFANIFDVEAVIKNNRYGFVLCLGVFLAPYDRKMWPLAKTSVIFVVLIGMLLTFSRATMVSGALAFVFVVLSSVPKSIGVRLFGVRAIGRAMAICVLLAAAGLVFQDEISKLWELFQFRLVSPLIDGTLFQEALSRDAASSEGYRLYVLGQILDYLAYHPIAGSHFSGLYLLFPEYQGSASTHNQYTDILLRTGLVGFALYVYLIVKVLRFFRREKGVLFGLVAILFYGLFHETFKMGYGGFIFGFLLSYGFWMRKRERADVGDADTERHAVASPGPRPSPVD